MCIHDIHTTALVHDYHNIFLTCLIHAQINKDITCIEISGLVSIATAGHNQHIVCFCMGIFHDDAAFVFGVFRGTYGLAGFLYLWNTPTCPR